MKSMIPFAFAVLFVPGFAALGQKQGIYPAIYSGVPLFDDRGQVVSAHGACIVKDKDRYYLFGERHSDTSNAFAGFTCYSSADLYNWKFERMALPLQDSGKLGPGRVGERVKVMKCPATGEYIMYMHADTLGYRDQFVGYATSKNITGPYASKGPLLFNGKPVRKWDMGTFQDQDGTGYVLIHGGEIYRLGKDYKSITEQVNKNMTAGFESPVLFRKDSIYYFLGSHLTSWERNDNEYYTATALKGPWTFRGLFAPEHSLTWNSQSTFVLRIEGSKDTTFLFMGDRWSYPKQASAATYVWQPLTVTGTSLSIPSFHQGWQINRTTGRYAPAPFSGTIIPFSDKRSLRLSGNWKQEEADTLSLLSSEQATASCTLTFRGTQVGVYGPARTDGGYARMQLRNSKGKTILSCIVDMYGKFPETNLRFLSPVLPKDSYTLTMTVLGAHSSWSDKRKSDYGSTGNVVAFSRFVIKE